MSEELELKINSLKKMTDNVKEEKALEAQTNELNREELSKVN